MTQDDGSTEADRFPPEGPAPGAAGSDLPADALRQRRHQMFPALTAGGGRTDAAVRDPAHLCVRRGAGPRVGDTGHGLTVILAGEVPVAGATDRAAQPIVTHGAGAFMGELAQLFGAARPWSTPTPRGRSRR